LATGGLFKVKVPGDARHCWCFIKNNAALSFFMAMRSDLRLACVLRRRKSMCQNAIMAVKRLVLAGVWLMVITEGLGSSWVTAQMPTGLKQMPSIKTETPSAATSTLLTPSLKKSSKQPAIEVRSLVLKPGEFPPASPAQYKVAFECTIRNIPPQTDFDLFPRYRCDLDKVRTVEVNRLPIYRIDIFPSADGITTKIVLIANKNAKDMTLPNHIRAALQLYRDQSAKEGVSVLKDFFYADGLLESK